MLWKQLIEMHTYQYLKTRFILVHFLSKVEENSPDFSFCTNDSIDWNADRHFDHRSCANLMVNSDRDLLAKHIYSTLFFKNKNELTYAHYYSKIIFWELDAAPQIIKYTKDWNWKGKDILYVILILGTSWFQICNF